MFTGIVESQGKVLLPERCGKIWVLRLAVPRRIRLKKGDSLAVNGVCLTVRSLKKDVAQFDLLDETLRRTNLGDVTAGELVNLEQPLRVGDRMGGHFLLGHVDAAGRVCKVQEKGADRIVTVAYPKKFGKYLVGKGSVGIDGVSLTVVCDDPGKFSVHLIPHTLAVTTLGRRIVGQRVNLEFDIMAKYFWKWRKGR